MATVNLLPWREERREELKKEFGIITAFVAAVAVLIVFLWQSVLSGAVDQQNSRNSFLQVRIDELSEQVKEIAELKKQKKALVERMDVIQSLQGNRPEIVHIFDQIVRTLPDGVFYNEIKRQGKTLTLKGTAESNNRISSLMRQLDASEWFENPNLQKVEANRAFGDQGSNFEMVVSLTAPSSDATTK